MTRPDDFEPDWPNLPKLYRMCHYCDGWSYFTDDAGNYVPCPECEGSGNRPEPKPEPGAEPVRVNAFGQQLRADAPSLPGDHYESDNATT